MYTYLLYIGELLLLFLLLCFSSAVLCRDFRLGFISLFIYNIHIDRYNNNVYKFSTLLRVVLLIVVAVTVLPMVAFRIVQFSHQLIYTPLIYSVLFLSLSLSLCEPPDFCIYGRKTGVCLAVCGNLYMNEWNGTN